MKKGLDINIRGITNGVHFDIINEHIKVGGGLDWDVLLQGYQVAQRTVWGVTYKVKFYLDEWDKMLYAEVIQ